jgi:hypothetical protein
MSDNNLINGVDFTVDRYALYRRRAAPYDYVIEAEVWPGSRDKAKREALDRGLIRMFGSQDQATLEAIRTRLMAAQS